MDYIHIHNKKDENWKKIDGDKIFLENWLSDDGRFVTNKSFVGFGVGRRLCWKTISNERITIYFRIFIN